MVREWLEDAWSGLVPAVLLPLDLVELFDVEIGIYFQLVRLIPAWWLLTIKGNNYYPLLFL